jgi:hypothetical protein
VLVGSDRHSFGLLDEVETCLLVVDLELVDAFLQRGLGRVGST